MKKIVEGTKLEGTNIDPELVKRGKDSNMPVVDQEKAVEDGPPATTSTLMPKSQTGPSKGKWALRAYGGAMTFVIVILLLRLILLPLIGTELPLMAFAIPVIWTAWNFGLLPSLFATGISTLIGWYVMLPPHFSFVLENKQDHLRLFLFVAVGVAMSLMGERQWQYRNRIEDEVAEKEVLLTEQGRLLAQVAADAKRRRTLIREMLYSVTEGRMQLCDTLSDLPEADVRSAWGVPVALTAPNAIRNFRRHVSEACNAVGLNNAKCQDFETAVGEAAMNAVTHGQGSGEGRVHVDMQRGVVQAWISDNGPGIAEETLHRAVLERGFSSAGTLGHGYWLILNTCDQIYLLTNPYLENPNQVGTIIVIEQHVTVREPTWMASDTPSRD